MISQIPQVLWRETTTEDSVEEFEVLIQVTPQTLWGYWK